MKQGQSRMSATTTGLLVFWLIPLSGIAGAAPGIAPSPKDEVVDKYLEGCLGKPVNAANCDKLRKDFVEILKEDLLRLGSTAKRAYLPPIVRMFRSDEVELRIAAADAIGMIGPQDSDVDVLAPLTNDPVPDVRHAVSNMLFRGKGNTLTLLRERTMPMRRGLTPEKPTDAAKFALPVVPGSAYLFDSSDAAVGRLSYVTKGKNDPAQFFKGKAKKGPYKLEEFREQYRYQLQDEQEVLNRAQEAEAKQMENVKPPDPTNTQAFTEYMEKVQSLSAGRGSKVYLDSYQPTLFGSPTVYVLEERQIGQRTYPTRYVVLYQDQAFKKSGYRLSWMTAPDDALKAAQVASLQEQREEEALKAASKKEDEAAKKREEALEQVIKKKDDQEKKKFKKGQSDLEKELGF